MTPWRAQEAAQTVQAIAEQATTSGTAGALNELSGVARSGHRESRFVLFSFFCVPGFLSDSTSISVSAFVYVVAFVFRSSLS